MKIILSDGNEPTNSRKPEYSKQDITDLSLLSGAITSLTQAMIVFHTYRDGIEVDPDYSEINIYTVLEMLIKPIDNFLSEGAPIEKGKK